MIRSRISLTVVIAIAVVSFSACSRTDASSGTPPGGGGGGRGGRGGRGGGEGGPVPVVTAAVQQRDVPVEVAAIGNVEAYETVSVRSQVTGVVTEVLFHEGDFVKKGDHLFTIDPRPYEALLAQAEAQLAKDRANADYVQLTSKRNVELAERGIVSKDSAQQSESQSA